MFVLPKNHSKHNAQGLWMKNPGKHHQLYSADGKSNTGAFKLSIHCEQRNRSSGPCSEPPPALPHCHFSCFTVQTRGCFDERATSNKVGTLQLAHLPHSDVHLVDTKSPVLPAFLYLAALPFGVPWISVELRDVGAWGTNALMKNCTFPLQY